MTAGRSLGIGLYSRAEAARRLQTPLRTLSRWVDGYVCELREGPQTYGPVIERNEDVALSFGDLVELMYVRGFRNAGIPLPELRDAGLRFRQDWNTAFPLATKRFATDGKHLLLARRGCRQEALTVSKWHFLRTRATKWFTLAILATFFFDNDISFRVVHALRELVHGHKLHAFREVFPVETPDTVWIPQVGRDGWIVISRDYNQRRRDAEHQALRENGVRALYMRHSGTQDTLFADAARLIRNWPKIEKWASALCLGFWSG